jgi:uncharacterized protein YoxC
MPLTNNSQYAEDFLRKRVNVAFWLNNCTTLFESTMSNAASGSQNKDAVNPELKETWADELADELETKLESGSSPMPDVQELARVAEKAALAQAKTPDEEIGDLLQKSDHKVDKGHRAVVTRDKKGKGKEKKKIEIEAPDDSTPTPGNLEEATAEDDNSYPMSFASQGETGQIREEIEVLTNRLSSMEKTIASLIAEREALPAHLNAIKQDINKNSTIMLEKIYALAESNTAPLNTSSVAAELSESMTQAQDKVSAAASFASAPPNKKSPIADPRSSLAGKRRFAPKK